MKCLISCNVMLFIIRMIFNIVLTNQKSYFGKISNINDFFRARREFTAMEKRRQLGGNIPLNAKEREVNRILMKFKRAEIDKAFMTGEPFPPSIHFFRAKPLIDHSKVFQMIRRMPKGGALHIHDIGLTNLDWVVKNVTYRNNPLYICKDENETLSYRYFVDYNPPNNPGCPWKLLRRERSHSRNREQFDSMLFNSLSLIVDNPEQAYPTTNAVWDVLTNIIANTGSLISLRSVFEDYFYEGLREFFADNIHYIEMRANLPEVFDSRGRTFNQGEVLQIYKDVAERFTRDNPGFFGVKIIFAGIKTFDNARILQDVKNSIRFRKQFPTFFAGYDLIFDEDRSPPLSNVVEALLFPRNLNPPVDLPYFLHAGETTWQGLTGDNNIIDAILLNTTRIGHGFTLVKHPLVKDLMRRSNKPVEMNPISHQVLKLIDDQRDHPAGILISEGFPIIIGCDAPPMWNALPLSHEYYIAFMAYTGRNDDLRVLKQLFLNTIQLSTLCESEKYKALKIWEQNWNGFLDEIIVTYGRRKSYRY